MTCYILKRWVNSAKLTHWQFAIKQPYNGFIMMVITINDPLLPCGYVLFESFVRGWGYEWVAIMGNIWKNSHIPYHSTYIKLTYSLSFYIRWFLKITVHILLKQPEPKNVNNAWANQLTKTIDWTTTSINSLF